MSTLEIKTRLSDAILNEAAPFIRSTPYVLKWNSQQLRPIVPNAHVCQLLHQCVVLCVNLVLYVCTSEISILYCLVIYVPVYLMTMARLRIWLSIGTSVEWCHESTNTVLSSHTTPFWIKLIRSHLWMCTAVNEQVLTNCPLLPIKLFSNGLQPFYYRQNVGWV